MADRHTLSISKLNDFREWLVPAIQHLTVCDPYLYLVRNYIKERKYDNTV